MQVLLLVTEVWALRSDLWQSVFQQEDPLDFLAQLGQPLKLSSEVLYNCLRVISRGATGVRALLGPQVANSTVEA